jgi:hypothetical protein
MGYLEEADQASTQQTLYLQLLAIIINRDLIVFAKVVLNCFRNVMCSMFLWTNEDMGLESAANY